MDFSFIWKLLNSFVMVWFCLVIRLSVTGVSSTWWSLDIIPWDERQQQDGGGNIPQKTSNHIEHTCLKISGYSYPQARFCSRYFDHMPAVTIGAKIGISECQRQLRYRHWNCTIPHNSDVYGPFTYLATKEAAFTHAIASAGVLHAIARSCKEARLATCGCSQAKRPAQLHRDWIWGGCGDNLMYAFWFTKHFVDLREKEASYPRGSRELANILVNLHNNRAGRMIVYKMSSVACKCHGVSGSCSLRSCWKQLPPFAQVGHRLTQQYDVSRRVRFNKRGTRLRGVTGRPTKPSEQQLIFTEASPDFCRLGRVNLAFHTAGRECRLDRRRAERCEVLCCGRGYRTFTREVPEKCHCRFIWCCKIKCQVCIRVEQVHMCN